MSEYNTDVLSDLPVVYYRCDEQSGTVAADSSGNGYNGTLQGVASYNQVGAIAADSDTAIRLLGGTGYLTIAPSVQPWTWSMFSFECWIKQIGGYQYLAVTYDGTTTTEYINGAVYTPTTWYAPSYQYKMQLTVDHTKVSGGADLSNYPLLISLTNANLKTTANGGGIQNSSGYDIIFTDSTQTTMLDHEIERYTATTGEIEMWVRIPTLSHTADTIIYVYFGNSAISTSQENKTGVWDSNYMGVYHLGNGTTLSVNDSTSNAANGSNHGATATTGQIDGGGNFNGTSQYIERTPTGLPTGSTSWTVEAWIKTPFSGSSGTYYSIVAMGTLGGTANQGMALYARQNGTVITATDGAADLIVSGAISANTPYHVVGSYDGTTYRLYVNGTLAGSLTYTFNLTYGIALIGWDGASGADFWSGMLDEVHFSKSIARSAGWITTEYNNQSNPSTFIAVGPLQGPNVPLIIDQSLSYVGTFNDATIDEVAIYNQTLTSSQVALHYSAGTTGRVSVYMLPATYRRNGTFATTYRRGS